MHRFSPDNPIRKVLMGVKKFQTEVYPEKEPLFKDLACKQEPKILFVTCSDSRIDPSLITQTEPGSMFLIQNAGNIIPPHGSAYGGTAASIEYAVTVLNVEHIIICGHSRCGAMSALLDQKQLEEIPALKQWITYAETTRLIMEASSDEHTDEEHRLDRCIEQNVQVQLKHLETFPSVAARLTQGKITLHGWFYDIETGNIDVYDAEKKEFLPFDQVYSFPQPVA